MKLKVKLTLLFSFLTAAILLLSSVAGYLFTKEQMTAGIQGEMQTSIISQVNKLDGWLIGKAKMLEITAATIQSTVNDGEITLPMVAGYKTADKELSDFYFGSVEGKMVDGSGWTPPADYDPRLRSWYKAANEQGKLVFSDPYLDMVTKQMAVSVAMPLKNTSGKARGILSEDILLQTLVDNIKTIKFHGEGYAFLFDTKGLLLAHPDQDLVSKNVFEVDTLKDMSPIFKDMLAKEQGFETYRYNGKDLLMAYQKVPSTGWILALSVPQEVIYKPLANLRWLFGLIAILSVFIVIVVTFVTAKRITKPLETLVGQVKLVASGDLTIQMLVNGKDEIAELTIDFNKMVYNLRELILRVHTSAEQVAASSEELTTSANESAQASNQVASSVMDIAHGAEMQLHAVVNTSAEVEKISVNIRQVAADANYAVAKSSLSAEKAKESGISISKAVNQMALIEQKVNASVEVVADLGERSKEIGQIVDTISNIAGQTNLLALNAAIEAARAGEQGRGFAVVAEEVRKLAEQSKEAAKQIADLISEIQRDTAKAVSAMDDGMHEVSLGAEVVTTAGSVYREIEELVKQVSDQITGISSAMLQMENGSQTIVSSVRQIDKISQETASHTQTVSVVTEEQSASMQEIASSSENLAQMAYELQQAVSKFTV
jgi:methyl-accepting chemotaxis protein